jgi:hypothetical protein
MKKTAAEILEKNILAALERSGLKRANAADRLGVDRAWFYRMLSTGRWKMEVLEGLAELLRMPLWRLFYEGSGMKDLSTDILVLPGGERPALVNLDDYVEVPIVKLQVELDIGGAGVPQESLGSMFVKKELVGEFSAGKNPCAIELRVKVMP